MDIYPSIASSDPLKYGDTLENLGSWPFLHIDVEDGNFTPNITFGIKTVKAVASKTKAKSIQVHLMTTNPMDYLEDLAAAGITEVFSHIEALPDPSCYLETCRVFGMKAGLALKAGTGLESVKEYLDKTDGLLFLTSAPRPIREEFSKEAFDKALAARRLLPKRIRTVADGGIDEDCMKELGAGNFDSVVLGRLVFSFPNPRARVEVLNNTYCLRRKQ